MRHTFGAALLLLVLAPLDARAQSVSYRLSFPEAAHHVMHIEATFASIPPAPLELRMSRSSPGRYAAHDFAKNVFDVRITDASGKALAVTRPNPHQWNVTGHEGQVRVSYKVFGDRLDGTYLAIDSAHAHINMPAAIMWARGLERIPAALHVERPADTAWRVATQLPSSGDGFTFTAPNLQYLMDSPLEFSSLSIRSFTVPDEQRTPVFRVAVHHTGTEADVDGLVRDIEMIAREARHVFREYPAFEGNTYTFIADYLPWATSDGMEHRNSSVMTSPSTIRGGRLELLDTIAHEFFHAWNVERIRPKSLEPFNFEDANISGELWLAEGFNSYYAPLIMKRSGLATVRDFALEMGRVIDTVVTSPGRQIRSAVEMSQFAAFTDEAASVDRNNFSNTVISYYTWGSAIALGLDLTLRDRTDGRRSLDDFMRQLWNRFGKPGVREFGYVATPYTHDDLKRVLGEVAGDQAFADDFFARYIEGRDVVDYAPLAARAGLVLRSRKDRAFAGALLLQGDQAGVRILGDVPMGSPVYAAGLEREDVIVSLGGVRVTQVADVERLVLARKPGDPLPVVFERRGSRLTGAILLIADPRVDLVPAEEAGQTLSDAQRRFRGAWLNSPAANAF
jgi:predicted metalloprotease with PDZ domain